MGLKQIFFDDLTGNELDEGELAPTILSLQIGDKSYAAEWDLSKYTATALTQFIEHSDLAGFFILMRPMLKLVQPDSEIIRQWVKANHPEIKVGSKGRIPAEIQALYNREVVSKTATA